PRGLTSAAGAMAGGRSGGEAGPVPWHDSAAGSTATTDRFLPGGTRHEDGVVDVVHHDVRRRADDFVALDAPRRQLARLEVSREQRVVFHLRRDDGIRLELRRAD